MLLHRYLRLVVSLLGCILLTACSAPLLLKQPIATPSTPPEFETAIRGLTNDLLRQVENYQRKALQDKKLSEAELPKINIILRPFMDAYTGYTSTLSKGERDTSTKDSKSKPIGKNSEELIYDEVAERKTCQDEFCPKEGCQEGKSIIFSDAMGQCQKDFSPVKRFGNISISPMSRESLKQATHIMYTVFRLEPAPFIQSKKLEKRYHIYAIVVDERAQPKKIVVANSEVWIANEVIAFPSKESSWSPVYLKDTQLENMVRNITKTKSGESVITSSEVDATIADASKAFGTGDIDKALDLYKEAERLPGGQQLKVYSALYQIYHRTGKFTEEKEALDRMTALGVASKELSFKFLFKVNSVEFGAAKKGMPETEETLNWLNQYPLWIDTIGEYFETSEECVEIIGHASPTGKAEYDQRLSLQRATRIKQSIIEKFKSVDAKVASVQGKGHNDCLLSEPNGICTGTDDEQDAYDRRVEFRVVDCPSLGKSN